MKTRRIVSLGIILGFASVASTAMAGEHARWRAQHHWWHAHHAIYHMENRIAFLEANPDADEGYKGPEIEAFSRHIRRLRAAAGPRWPHWPTPCCYSRRPIYLR